MPICPSVGSLTWKQLRQEGQEPLKFKENDHQKHKISLKTSLKEAKDKLVMADSEVTALKESEILLKKQIVEKEPLGMEQLAGKLDALPLFGISLDLPPFAYHDWNMASI
ncbi:hypothetical protein SAY87_020644 [Trapa incisa]|uniref:Uncharacterized protein n=2 Tax=Trapa TaxID=22665 RepID=A0AAN7MF82_TRANT|nr:hypothetical protein SAY87_020644 [Trapa incisa]KAK4804369.1 hypothetical protein SAY86_004186 [Trapa natans]